MPNKATRLRYERKKVKDIHVKFFPKDRCLYLHVLKQGKSKMDYIRSLIAADIIRNGGEIYDIDYDDFQAEVERIKEGLKNA